MRALKAAILGRAASAALAVIVMSAAAQAQQATPAPAPAAPAAPAPISPSHLAAGLEVVKASGMIRGFDRLIPQYMEQLKATFAASRPEIATELAQTLNDLRPEFDKQRDDIVNTAARLYAQALSEEDLKAIADFYRSPAGSRFVDAQPKVLDGLFVEMQAWSRKVSEYMLSRVRAELKKKNIDL